MEHLREQGESKYFSESAWGAYDDFFPKQKAHNTGLYIQDQIRITGRFFATIGARFDHHSQGGNALTYRLAPGYFVERPGLSLRPDWKQGPGTVKMHGLGCGDRAEH